MPWIPGSSSGSGGWTWVGEGVPDTPFPGSNTSYLDPTATTSDTDKPVEHGRVMLAVGEGPHAGLVNGLKSVYLNDVPVQNADGTLNFNDVSVAVVNGTLNQNPISGFEGAESEVGVGQKVLKATPIVRSISNTTATHARVKISVPSLQTIDTTTGKTSSAHLSYKIEVQPNGGSYQAVTLGDGGVIEKQFTSKLIKGYKFALPGTGPWNIRLTRLENDSASQYLQNDLYFESLATIIDGRYSYPMTACIAVACNANQFNSIPKVTADWKARIISVPANYDPIARTYATTGTGTTAGTWDGTFKQAWSDNPAWVFYDMVTNNLFGCGLTTGAPDKFLLYQIAQYCDVMVSDGLGGTEPRFTCSVNIETQDEAIKALGYLASIFRGSAYWAGGAVVPVQDKDETPSAQFTNSNVVEGKFVYTSSAKPARHTACIVKYNDPNTNYELTPLLVQDNAGVARYGYNPVEVVAYGCASRGQASRLGLMTLTTELSQTEGISFSTALEAVPLRPGRIIKVHDAFRFGKRFGGRVMSSTTTSVTLDAPVTLESGKTYQLSCTLPNGTVEVKPVSTGAGTVSTLAVSSAFSVAPQTEGQWILVANDFAPMLYRVLGIKEGSDGSYEITGLFHNPAKYAAVESGLILDALAAVPLAYHAPVTNLTLTESMAVQTDRLVSTLLASWTPVADITGYLAVASRDGGPWQPMTVAGAGATLADIQPGSWKVRVVARYATGDSTYTESASYTTTGFSVTTSPAQAASSAAATAQNAASAAQTTANAAQTSATTANNLLADIAADNKLTPAEKQQARCEWDVIAAEKAGIDTQADAFTQSRTTYDSAFQALATYLNAGTTWSSGIPSWISDANLATTTNITGSTFRSRWKAYYDARTTLLNAIAVKAKALADAAQNGVNAINSADALTNADKISLMESWKAELQTQSSLDASATSLAITTERTAYDNAMTALSTGLIAAGAPSNWASVWPDGSTLAATGIMTSLSGWWATIASKRATLQVAISQAQSSAAQAAAIAAAATDALSKANAAQIKTPSLAPFASTDLPALPNASYAAGTFWLTTDGKEYQVTPNGSGWQPVAFYATALVGQLVASQLTVANFDNLIPNPTSSITSAPAWSYESAGLYNTGASSALAPAGWVRRLTSPGLILLSPPIGCKPGDQFCMQADGRYEWLYDGSSHVFIDFLDASLGWVNGCYGNNIGSQNDASPSTSIVSGACPAGACYVQFGVISSGGTAGRITRWNNFYARRMFDANLTVEGFLQAIFIKAAKSIKSLNYAAGSAGNAPTGFCLSATPFTTTFKDGTTDSGCLMELGGSANFGGYKVATINTQVMTATNRIINGSFWRGAFAPWSSQPHWSYALVAASGTNTTYPLQTVVNSVQNFNAPGYTSGTVYLKFTPSASMVINSGGGQSGTIYATVKVYLYNHSTGVETLVYSGAGNASYSGYSGGSWSPGQQSINVTSYLSAAPAGYGIAVVLTAYMENNNGNSSVYTSITGTIDVTGFELVF